MKKLICTVAALCAVLLLFGAQFSRSAGDDIQVKLNGDPVTLSRCPERHYGEAYEQLYVPLLSFCEMMGAKTVIWKNLYSFYIMQGAYKVACLCKIFVVVGNSRNQYVADPDRLFNFIKIGKHFADIFSALAC